MNNDRRVLFWLIASGRITAREAERLLAIGPEGEDKLARLALCFAFAWLLLSQFGGLLVTYTRILLALVPGAHHAVALATHCLGGLL